MGQRWHPQQLRSWCIVSQREQFSEKTSDRYLHWLAVNLDTVELLGGVGCAVGLAKDDSGNTGAASSLGVGEKNFPH